MLPKLFINNQVIKRKPSTKFFGILLDENLPWKEHLELMETKIAKNIGLIHQIKPYLHKNSLSALYFSDIHSYIKFFFIIDIFSFINTNDTTTKKNNKRTKQNELSR